MPPRKSNASATAADGDKDPGFGVEELNLPRTMVQRLAKGVLPANTQIQKDALLAISKSATVFVNYLASRYAAAHNPARSTSHTSWGVHWPPASPFLVTWPLMPAF